MTVRRLQGAGVTTVARTPGEVRELQHLWSQLQPQDLDADLEHFLIVCENDPETLAPHVLLVDLPDGPPLIVVARIARHRLLPRLGYLRLPRVGARALVVSFDGILGARTDHHREVAVRTLRDQVDAGVASLTVLQKVPETASLPAVVARTVPRGLVATGPRVPRHVLDLPDSFDALMEQRPAKSRQRIRRERSVFRREHAGRLEVRRLDRPDQGAQLEAALAAVGRLTYQQALGVGSVDPAVHLRLRTLAAEQGRLRTWLLYVDGRPVAYWWGIAFGHVLYPGTTGFDAGGPPGSGFYTMLQMFEDCCADPAVRLIDFGFGDAEYKQRFASGQTTCRDLLVFSPRGRSLAVRAGLAAGAALGRLGDRLGRAGLGSRVKRAWRANRAGERR